ncbi:MAG: sugar transferase [Acidimicrobiia bacterium]
MKTHGGDSPSSSPLNGNVRSGVATPRPSGPYVNLVKPILDRVIGLFLLTFFSPIIIIAGLVILIRLGRPVFYSQERIGLDGRSFRLHKLRTMVPDRRSGHRGYHGEERRLTHKSLNDPRVAPVGRVLRRMRLDELPQFWNVVKGDMSLVGPRPELPDIVRQYEPWQHQRHQVKPGVTGPWQVSHRNGKLMHECTELDLDYLEHIGLLHDLRILAETPLAMVGGRKGY